MKGWMSLVGVLVVTVASGCATPETSVYIPNPNCKAVNFRPDAEPVGFNGIKWETHITTLKGMKLHRKDPSNGGIDFYFKEGDSLKIGNEIFKKVQYGFLKDRFYVGMVSAKNLTDWQTLKEAVFLQFGEGAKPFHNKDEYLWVGKDSIMALQYNEIRKVGVFYIRSEAMAKKVASN